VTAYIKCLLQARFVFRFLACCLRLQYKVLWNIAIKNLPLPAQDLLWFPRDVLLFPRDVLLFPRDVLVFGRTTGAVLSGSGRCAARWYRCVWLIRAYMQNNCLVLQQDLSVIHRRFLPET